MRTALQVAPLPVIDLVYWLACKRRFSKPLQMLSLEGAADLDRKDEVKLDLPTTASCVSASA